MRHEITPSAFDTRGGTHASAEKSGEKYLLRGGGKRLIVPADNFSRGPRTQGAFVGLLCVPSLFGVLGGKGVGDARTGRRRKRGRRGMNNTVRYEKGIVAGIKA